MTLRTVLLALTALVVAASLAAPASAVRNQYRKCGTVTSHHGQTLKVSARHVSCVTARAVMRRFFADIKGSHCGTQCSDSPFAHWFCNYFGATLVPPSPLVGDCTNNLKIDAGIVVLR